MGCTWSTTAMPLIYGQIKLQKIQKTLRFVGLLGRVLEPQALIHKEKSCKEFSFNKKKGLSLAWKKNLFNNLNRRIFHL